MKFVVSILLSLLPVVGFAYPVTSGVHELINAGSKEDTVLYYNFGSVFVDTRMYVDYTLTAKGGPVELRRMDIAGMEFNAYTNCPASLPEGQKCTVRITYWPHQKEADVGRLYLTFSDGRTIINLYGRGI